MLPFGPGGTLAPCLRRRFSRVPAICCKVNTARASSDKWYKEDILACNRLVYDAANDKSSQFFLYSKCDDSIRALHQGSEQYETHVTRLGILSDDE